MFEVIDITTLTLQLHNTFMYQNTTMYTTNQYNYVSIFVFLPLSCLSDLHILGINPLSGFANTFPYSIREFIVFLAMQKHLGNLIWYNLVCLLLLCFCGHVQNIIVQTSVKEITKMILLHVEIQFPQHHLLKKPSFLPLCVFGIFIENQLILNSQI